MSLTSPDVPITGEVERLLDASSDRVDLLRRLLRGDRAVGAALRTIGVDPASLAADLPAPHLVTEDQRQLRNDAVREARLLGHHRVEPIHLLLAMLYTDSPTAEYLKERDVTLYDLRAHLRSRAAGRHPARPQSLALPLQRRPSLWAAVSPSPVFLLPAGVMLAAGLLLFRGVPEALAVPCTILFVVGGWITSLCLHEFAHALVAYAGGDRSVAANGYLSLNPLRYANPMLSILLPTLFVLLGGIGLPGGAVYVNHSALRSPRWSSYVAAAGPLATLLFTLVIASPFALAGDHLFRSAWFSDSSFGFWGALAFLVVIELGALVLNLLPIPPLDGFGIVAPYLPADLRQTAARMGSFGLLLVFALLWLGPFSKVFWQGVFRLAGSLHVPLLLVAAGQQHMSLLNGGG
jgi:Zn-dependent protease